MKRFLDSGWAAPVIGIAVVVLIKLIIVLI